MVCAQRLRGANGVYHTNRLNLSNVHEGIIKDDSRCARYESVRVWVPAGVFPY